MQSFQKFCGKKSEGAKFCQKFGCNLPIDESTLVDDYRVNLVLQDDNCDIHEIVAFSKNLKDLEQKTNSGFEKISSLTGKQAVVKIDRGRFESDNKILQEIELQDDTG